MVDCASVSSARSFGTNPDKGGSPPNERNSGATIFCEGGVFNAFVVW